jgi:hypothetical protein
LKLNAPANEIEFAPGNSVWLFDGAALWFASIEMTMQRKKTPARVRRFLVRRLVTVAVGFWYKGCPGRKSASPTLSIRTCQSVARRPRRRPVFHRG